MVSKGTMQASRGSREPRVASIHDGDEAHQQTPWHEALRVQEWHTDLVGNQDPLSGLKT